MCPRPLCSYRSGCALGPTHYVYLHTMWKTNRRWGFVLGLAADGHQDCNCNSNSTAGVSSVHASFYKLETAFSSDCPIPRLYPPSSHPLVSRGFSGASGPSNLNGLSLLSSLRTTAPLILLVVGGVLIVCTLNLRLLPFQQLCKPLSFCMKSLPVGHL